MWARRGDLQVDDYGDLYRRVFDEDADEMRDEKLGPIVDASYDVAAAEREDYRLLLSDWRDGQREDYRGDVLRSYALGRA